MASAAFTGGATVTYTDGVSLDKTADSKSCISFTIGTPEYERDWIGSPGVDGVGSKTFGYRNQRVELRVMYVAASETAAITAAVADSDALGSGGASDLVLAGTTFFACFLDQFEIGQPTSTGAGKMILECDIVVNSKRLA